MHCLCCGKEMKIGYLQAPSMIVWDTELQDGIVNLTDRGFFLARSWIKPSTIKSCYCEDCGLLITFLKDRDPKLCK